MSFSIPIDAAPSAAGSIVEDSDPRRWRMLVLLGWAELLGMSLWFAASAVSAPLAARWHLSPSSLGWLTAIVQLGFVMGTAFSALLNLADIVPARLLFSLSALVGAFANAALLQSTSYRGLLVCRLLTGFALAGVYPPAMKMISTWFRARRGLAVGTVVGALTVGKAGPYLVHAIPGAGVQPVILSATFAATLAALLVFFFYRDGPFPFPPRPFSWDLVATVFRERRWRLATGGYLGHMFELYSAWTWIPTFVAMSAAAAGRPAGPTRDELSALVAFCAIAIGGAGCGWGGFVVGRRGRAGVVAKGIAGGGGRAPLPRVLFGQKLLLLPSPAPPLGVFLV